MKIGITGGKGGTGKSTVAISLAISLSKSYKVLLVDCDVGCPNDHTILGSEREKVRDTFIFKPIFDESKCIKCGLCGRSCKRNAILSIKDRFPILVEENCNGCQVCSMVCPVGAIKRGKRKVGTIYSYKGKGFDCLSAETVVGFEEESIVIKELKKEVDNIGSNYDFIIFDSPAGSGCPVISSLKGVDYTYVVAEPTPFGKHDFDVIAALLKKMNIPFSTIINKSGLGDDSIIPSSTVVLRIPFDRKIYSSYSIANFDGIDEIDKLVDHIESLGGVYALVLKVKNEIEVEVGSLGRLLFKPGKYVYVGSAMNGILKRVKRHKSKEKGSLHWHIDYLTSNKDVEFEEAYFLFTNDKEMECEVAKRIAKYGEIVKGFGSTDSKCNSHLIKVDKSEFLSNFMRRLF